MPPIPQQVNNPIMSPEIEQLLGGILLKNHETGTTTEQLLTYILQKLSGNGQNANAESLLGMNLIKLEEIAKELGKINGEAGQIKVSDGGIITFKGLKGDKGDKGDRGEKGDKGDAIVGPQGERGPQGIQGISGMEGKRGFPGKDGKNGLDGQDGRPGKDGKNGRDGKDRNSDTAEQIISKIKGLISYSDIKDAPEFRMGGTRPDSISLAEAMALLGGVETPSGTRNGVNKVFTVLHTPKFITFNGQTWYEGAGYSIVGLTVTLDIAPNATTDPSPDVIRSHW